jgi:D-threo-aldose 1-dehydrogenase
VPRRERRAGHRPPAAGRLIVARTFATIRVLEGTKDMPPSLTSRRQIGRTSLAVPPVGFGSAHLGGMWGRVPAAVAQATLAAAWDGGIRYFDSAPFYGRGLAEHRVGSFLIDQPREQFVLTTKVGRVFHRPRDPKTFDRAPWIGGLGHEIEFDYSYDGVMRSYEQSLLRLGLDTIDALLIHDLDAGAHGGNFEGHVRKLTASGIKALEALKASGDIKAIGMGINVAESLAEVAKLVDLDFVLVAMPYTLLDQAVLHTGLAWCIDKGVSVVIGAPFASGILVTGAGPGARYRYSEASDEVQAKVRAIAAVCARHGVALPTAALQFPLAHPAVVSIIPGGARPEEVTANLAAYAKPAPADFWAELKALGLIDPASPTPV